MVEALWAWLDNPHPTSLCFLFNYTDFCRDDQVSPYELEVFLRWFGPLKGCCGRMLDALRAGSATSTTIHFNSFAFAFLADDLLRLLAGFMPAMEANALLENKVSGTFLIRFSKTKPGSFAVTFVDYTKLIKHVLLYNADQGYGVSLKVNNTRPTMLALLCYLPFCHSDRRPRPRFILPSKNSPWLMPANSNILLPPNSSMRYETLCSGH